MFQEFMIAAVLHEELDAEYNSAKAVEGMTVEVARLFDRVMFAIWTALSKHLTKAQKPAAILTPGGATGK
jgi:hypothetical protein